MCGIIGYVGRQEAAPILLEGLERMEYRGYDSTGMAVCGDGVLRVCKKKGRVQVLREMSHDGADLPGTLGIGHTRWATHGEPSDVNAHPHLSQSGKFAVVHNGIIENFIALKEELLQKGYTFRSETDTEVVAQLLDYYYSDCGDFFEAMNRLLHAMNFPAAPFTRITYLPFDLVNIARDFCPVQAFPQIPKPIRPQKYTVSTVCFKCHTDGILQ